MRRFDFAVAFLSYSLAPTAQYPVQLAEAVDLLRYLTYDEGKDPSKVCNGFFAFRKGILQHYDRSQLREIRPELSRVLRSSLISFPSID